MKAFEQKIFAFILVGLLPISGVKVKQSTRILILSIAFIFDKKYCQLHAKSEQNMQTNFVRNTFYFMQ